MSKHRPRDATLPRRRNAAAKALERPEHRQRVMPDKRRAINERIHKQTARVFGEVLSSLAAGPHVKLALGRVAVIEWWLQNQAKCTDWKSGEDHGFCQEVRCADCPLKWPD